MSIYQKGASYIAECVNCDLLFGLEKGQVLKCPKCGTEYVVEERTHMSDEVFNAFQAQRERFNDAELDHHLKGLA